MPSLRTCTNRQTQGLKLEPENKPLKDGLASVHQKIKEIDEEGAGAGAGKRALANCLHTTRIVIFSGTFGSIFGAPDALNKV